MLDQTFNDQCGAMANLAAVDHGGQKALCSRGGPAVSDPAVLAAAFICRPSADSHEASSIQLLIRDDECSRCSVDRHARVKWREAESIRRCVKEPYDVFILCRIQTIPSLNSFACVTFKPFPHVKSTSSNFSSPSTAIKLHPLFIKLKSFANTAWHSNLLTVFAYSLIGGILHPNYLDLQSEQANILSFYSD